MYFYVMHVIGAKMWEVVVPELLQIPP